jgi:hypothetical protein
VHIDDVRSELEDLGEEQFSALHGRWFLVVATPDSIDSVANFVNTASRRGEDVLAGKKSLDGVDIHPLQPDDADHVTVGREGTEVVLPSSKVSKLHAVFAFAGGLPSLSDAGSKNGTMVNGHRLAAHQPVPVDAGDTIQFASVSATLWSVDDLVAAARLP